MSNFRVGIGYDVHPLVDGRPLVLGGVTVPFDRGLDGWSDADVLTHVIIEAMLGASGLGDIGTHFPPGDQRYKNISSLFLLGEVNEKLAKAGWNVVNIDTTVVAEQPKLKDHIEPMRKQISSTLGIDIECVSVKASTNNGLGYLGRVEGIATYAVALIERNGKPVLSSK
jgi:2-C-methyl-D-erythritol 2,4-cyclodiphosphate synthase